MERESNEEHKSEMQQGSMLRKSLSDGFSCKTLDKRNSIMPLKASRFVSAEKKEIFGK